MILFILFMLYVIAGGYGGAQQQVRVAEPSTDCGFID